MELNSEIVRFENKVTDYPNPSFANNTPNKMQVYQSAVKLRTRLVRTKTRTIIIVSVLAALLAGIITAIAVTLTSGNDDSALDPSKCAHSQLKSEYHRIIFIYCKCYQCLDNTNKYSI